MKRDALALLDDLTDREREILSLLAQGMRNDDIAAQLYISPQTVQTHVRNILGSFGSTRSSRRSRSPSDTAPSPSSDGPGTFFPRSFGRFRCDSCATGRRAFMDPWGGIHARSHRVSCLDTHLQAYRCCCRANGAGPLHALHCTQGRRFGHRNHPWPKAGDGRGPERLRRSGMDRIHRMSRAEDAPLAAVGRTWNRRRYRHVLRVLGDDRERRQRVRRRYRVDLRQRRRRRDVHHRERDAAEPRREVH